MDYVVWWTLTGAAVVAYDCDTMIDACEELDGKGGTPFYVMWTCLVFGMFIWPLFLVDIHRKG